jgi:hypothetical protein
MARPATTCSPAARRATASTAGRERTAWTAGDGQDVLSFTDRTTGVTADVAAGRTSDGDTFADVETVWGGDGPDRLLGGPGPDNLFGGAGADTVRGAGGGDTLSGGLGADRLDGGEGHDLLSGDPQQGDGYYTPRVRLSRDVLRGGPGDDELLDSGGANGGGRRRRPALRWRGRRPPAGRLGGRPAARPPRRRPPFRRHGRRLAFCSRRAAGSRRLRFRARPGDDRPEGSRAGLRKGASPPLYFSTLIKRSNPAAPRIA